MKINSESKISDRPAPKKKIDPKFFDPEKGAQCFFCHEWGHKSQECPKKVCAMASAEDKFERRVNEWHTVQGVLGVHSCEIGLDSGAEMTVVAADLVPTSAFTGERKRIAGVHSIGKEVPLARLRLTIGPRRLQVTAAVLDRPPHDVLLGRDCQELPELLEEALSQKKLRDQDTVAVVTRKQARIEKLEDSLDLAADNANITDDFPFDTDFGSDLLTGSEPTTRKTRRQKHLDALRVFQDKAQDLEEEASIGRKELHQEQREDTTLEVAWQTAEKGEQDYVIDGGLLYKRSLKDGQEPLMRWLFPRREERSCLHSRMDPH